MSAQPEAPLPQNAGPRIAAASPAAIAEAAAMLRAGGLVAFPTETVYGLGADATQDGAVAGIFQAKGRPTFNPLIVHVPDLDAAQALIDIPPAVLDAVLSLWPGPLTLVANQRPNAGISRLATVGLPTLAVRVPAHPVAQALLRAAGRPIAAPSANRSGNLSPTTPAHVARSLGAAVPLVLAGGRAEVGLESTILDVTDPAHLRLLRPGGLARDVLERFLGPVERSKPVIDDRAPSAPGQLASHYAPSKPLRLDAVAAEPHEGFLTFGPDAFNRGGALRRNLSAEGDLAEAAANLFAMLHELDQAPEVQAIAVMAVPDEGLGSAILDRLRRAAAPRP